MNDQETIDSFLKKYRLPSAGTGKKKVKRVYTHTMLPHKNEDGVKVAGSYNIPADQYDTLHDLMNEEYMKGRDMYLTQANQDDIPILVDLDFRYEMSDSRRNHTERHIRGMVQIYNSAIQEVLDLPSTDLLKCVVMERAKPYRDKGVTKDGIHMMYPEIKASTDSQLLIREIVLDKCSGVLGTLPLLNLQSSSPYNDVVDKAVITKNPWMMFGTNKPDKAPYSITHVYHHQQGNVVDSEISMNYRQLLDYLSIHKPNVSTLPVSATYRKKVDAMNSLRNKRARRVQSTGLHLTKKYVTLKPRRGNLLNYMDEAKELTAVLSKTRADEYRTWMEVGWCLHTIDPCLLDSWIEFSRQSVKFVEGECEKKWGTMEDRGLSISALRNWAKIDSPDEYKEICRKSLIPIINRSMTGTTYDVATVVKQMFKHELKCVNPTKNHWCVFNNHRWHMDDFGHSIMKRISDDLLGEYLFLVASNNLHALDDTSANKGMTLTRASAFAQLSYKLRDITFKKKILAECKVMLFDSEFIENLNSNDHLIGFENGVYDLELDQFRDGRPEDMISISTGNFYQEYDGEDEVIGEIMEFMEQLFPEPDLRKYVWHMLAASLYGVNDLEKFWFFTGAGGNGKSKLITLMELSFGKYTVSFPSQLLTQARPQANAATPAMHRAVHSRFGTFQELEQQSNLNIAFFKQITGGDKLPVRGLYEGMTDFKPKFNLVICCNHLPKLPADDDASWRRIQVVPFKSSFVENPDPDDPYQFPRDIKLSHRMETWKQPFMFILLNYYKEFRKNGSHLPKCAQVDEATQQYQQQNDVISRFVKEMIIPEKGSRVMITAAYSLYKAWIRSAFDDATIKKVDRNELKLIINKKLKQNYQSSGSKRGWTGYRLGSLYEDSESDEEPDMPTENLSTNKTPPKPLKPQKQRGFRGLVKQTAPQPEPPAKKPIKMAFARRQKQQAVS